MPQCGLAPGFISIAGTHLARRFDALEEVRLRVGALTEFPTNRLKYDLTWSTAGLIHEYLAGLRSDRRREDAQGLEPLEGHETFTLDGTDYEAFNTSGGLGTLCGTAGRARNLNYKTVRYPGHCEIMKLLIRDLGLGKRPELLVEIFDYALPLALSGRRPHLRQRDRPDRRRAEAGELRAQGLFARRRRTAGAGARSRSPPPRRSARCSIWCARASCRRPASSTTTRSISTASSPTASASITPERPGPARFLHSMNPATSIARGSALNAPLPSSPPSTARRDDDMTTRTGCPGRAAGFQLHPQAGRGGGAGRARPTCSSTFARPARRSACSRLALLALTLFVRPDMLRSWPPRCAVAAAALFALALAADPGPLAALLYWTALTLAVLLPRTARFDDGWRWAQRLGLHGLLSPVRPAPRPDHRRAGRGAGAGRRGIARKAAGADPAGGRAASSSWPCSPPPIR